jgi:hypothetical protein
MQNDLLYCWSIGQARMPLLLWKFGGRQFRVSMPLGRDALVPRIEAGPFGAAQLKKDARGCLSSEPMPTL